MVLSCTQTASWYTYQCTYTARHLRLQYFRSTIPTNRSI